AVIEVVGGFSRDFSCEDMEFTFRVHEHFLRRQVPYRIVAMPEPAGRTEGPDRIASLVSQRARWQRVVLETTWRYRHMILNPRYKAFGLVGLPFCIVSEIVAPFVEVFALLTLGAAAVFGVVNWVEYVLGLGVMSFANAALTVAAIRLEDVGTRSYRLRDLAGQAQEEPREGSERHGRALEHHQPAGGALVAERAVVERRATEEEDVPERHHRRADDEDVAEPERRAEPPGRGQHLHDRRPHREPED